MDELERLRDRLRSRVETCRDRFDDAASELLELHGIPSAELHDRIERLAAARDDAGRPAHEPGAARA